MKTSPKGIELIKKHEGLRSHPYLDFAKTPTIGYGTTVYPSGERVSLYDEPITSKKAEELLKTSLMRFEKDVSRLVKKNLTQNQFDAIMSFVYNVGIGAFGDSTLLKKVNVNPNDPSIPAEFCRWIFANGKELQGLRTRRAEEAELYKKHNYE